MSPASVPRFDELFNPILRAIRALGGSAALSELYAKAADEAELPENVLDVPHVRHRGTPSEIQTGLSEVEYRLRWALTYLKKAGYVNNSSRGVWSLTELGRSTAAVDPRAVVGQARAADREDEASSTEDGSISTLAPAEIVDDDDAPRELRWEDELLDVLRVMKADAFERLSQRLLRELGFDEVDVLGRSGDQGIDGRGVLRFNEVISMGVVFQCKRYSNTVGPDAIRDFRGGMEGRAERGLVITTASFTNGAVKEANRDGAMPIDLIDGARLVQLLKQFQLGVETQKRTVEDVAVNKAWFDSL